MRRKIQGSLIRKTVSSTFADGIFECVFVSVTKLLRLLLKGEVSREFGVVSKTPKPSRNGKVLTRFVVNYHPIVLRLSMSVWQQMDWVRMDCNLKKVRLTVFKFPGFVPKMHLSRSRVVPIKN